MKFKRIIGVLLYVGLTKHLPSSTCLVVGKVSKKLRYICAKLILSECGKNVNIERGATFSTRVSIGNNSGIGKNANISGAVVIGNDVMMGPNCTIYVRNHAFDRTDIAIREQGYYDEKPVVIENDVWIGGNVSILPGVHISSGAVIGAGSIVTKDVIPYAVVAGNPAKIIKMRK